jgi:hypothetical protein
MFECRNSKTMGILVQNSNAPSLKQASEEIATRLTADELVGEIHHLRLRVGLTKTICSAIEVERLAEALREGSLKPEAGNPRDVAVGEKTTSIVPARKSRRPTNSNLAERGPKENAIAASISELYDRLGGFIKE